MTQSVKVSSATAIVVILNPVGYCQHVLSRVICVQPVAAQFPMSYEDLEEFMDSIEDPYAADYEAFMELGGLSAFDNMLITTDSTPASKRRLSYPDSSQESSLPPTESKKRARNEPSAPNLQERKRLRVETKDNDSAWITAGGYSKKPLEGPCMFVVSSIQSHVYQVHHH